MPLYLSDLKNLNIHKDLLLSWTFRIIRARYQQSVLGGAWAIIQPVTSVMVFSVLFTYLVPIQTDVPYFLFSFSAMVPWTFLSSSVTDMVNSLVENMNLVTKIYFPREILPIAALLARFVDFLIAEALIVVLMIVYKQQFLSPAILYIPFVIFIQMILSLGLGFIGAALNVFYRDIRHVVVLGLQLWFYASPIIYPIDRIPERYLPFYFLNPMAGVITAYREILFEQSAPGNYLLISIGIALVIFFLGYWLFKRLEFKFADVV